ncbi:MAG TPA: hypothetical protein PKA82_01185 [Pyrinomonadaceae bacterium]|nr:hypothetical protein [Pyrinomonadaceae bacterium]
MELEFDKEMDALLRRARGGTAAAVGDHIDADAISAFAENALPDAMRRVYMSHMADCGKCRKLLSFSIANQETAAFAAAPQAAEVATAATESLWSRFFRAPNLAMAMGALVLMFGSLLGYLALQNQSSPNATVATANKTESRADGTATQPFEAPNAAAPAANAPQVAASPAMAESAPATSAPGGSTLAKGGETAPANVPGDTTTTDAITGGVPAAKPATAAPPAASGAVAAEREVTTSKDEDKAVTKADDYTRDGTPRSPKKIEVGPSRSGNVQQQIERNSTNVYEIPLRKRSAGGRTFEDRNGVWTDTAYNGQAVSVYKRGSEPYKKLDSSIRSIADQLGGTVIIVAGSRAYKIQ